MLGLWVRQADIQLGERTGAEPALLDPVLRRRAAHAVSRGMLGPWTHTVGGRWTRVVKRIPVPPGAKDAILSTGLMGSTGTLDIDGLTVELVPIGGAATTNLIVNGDFELGDPGPAHWTRQGRASGLPGQRLPGRAGAVSCPVVRQSRRGAAGRSVRGAGASRSRPDVRDCEAPTGRRRRSIFLERITAERSRRPGRDIGEPVLSWSGTSGWQDQTAVVPVPPGAVRAVLSDREDRRDRLDPAGRCPGHGQSGRPGRRVDPVPRRGRHAELAAGGGRRRRSPPAAGSTSRSCWPGPPAATGW